MTSKEERKEAIRKFKERKARCGVFAIRCTASGRAWVDITRNLEAAKNSAWFSLRNGSFRDRTLQDEWNAHGEAAFVYEVLDQLDEDVSPLLIADQLKEKRDRVLAASGAFRIP